MKKITIILCFFYSMNLNVLCGKNNTQIIFDTDMGPDYDDIGAIAMLHSLVDKGECELLACIASDAHPLIAPTIDLYNKYYKKGYIPVGEAVKTAPSFLSKNVWNEKILNQFPQYYEKGKNYPSAVNLYREILSQSPDGSVTIVTVGFMSNLEALLQSSADKYSVLNGEDLVKLKVKKMVSMAGVFPSGREFNVYKHPEAAKYVFDNWPTPIIFSGFEIGKDVLTGKSLFESNDDDSPIAWGYRYNGKTYKDTVSKTRQSWDQTAVLVAVRNPEDYFYVIGPGGFNSDDKGYNEWNPSDIKKQHFFLVHKYPLEKITTIINDLMSYKP